MILIIFNKNSIKDTYSTLLHPRFLPFIHRGRRSGAFFHDFARIWYV